MLRILGRSGAPPIEPGGARLPYRGWLWLSEVLHIRWEHVDLAAGVMQLPNTKAGRPQTVTINAPARQILTGLRPYDVKASPWVLPGRLDSSQPLKKDAMEAAWQKIRAAAGLDDVHLHDLRHTVGTYAGQSGATHSSCGTCCGIAIFR